MTNFFHGSTSNLAGYVEITDDVLTGRIQKLNIVP